MGHATQRVATPSVATFIVTCHHFTLMSYLLGIDVSTTATKAIVIDERGELVAAASDEYEFFTPRPLWAEQNPADWWRACVNVVRRVLEKIPATEIAGIGLTGQMH